MKKTGGQNSRWTVPLSLFKSFNHHTIIYQHCLPSSYIIFNKDPNGSVENIQIRIRQHDGDPSDSDPQHCQRPRAIIYLTMRQCPSSWLLLEPTFCQSTFYSVVASWLVKSTFMCVNFLRIDILRSRPFYTNIGFGLQRTGLCNQKPVESIFSHNVSSV